MILVRMSKKWKFDLNKIEIKYFVFSINLCGYFMLIEFLLKSDVLK